jgi:hypothetical protein
MKTDLVTFFDMVVAILKQQGEYNEDDRTSLAGFVYGKHLAPYSYRDTPEIIATSWLACKVADKIKELVSH